MKKITQCQNCKNKRISRFSIQIAGLKIHICKQCWIGFAYGFKKDFELFYRNESEFLQILENTRKSEKA